MRIDSDLPSAEPRRAHRPRVRLHAAPCVRVHAGPRRKVHRLEIPYGHFERRVPLPQSALAAGARELVDGCLILRLRKIHSMETR